MDTPRRWPSKKPTVGRVTAIGFRTQRPAGPEKNELFKENPLTQITKLVCLLLINGIAAEFCFASCSLDHLLIGCNPDGLFGTDDDQKLVVDCRQKYRHSDPNNAGDPTWLNWHYPMYYSSRYNRYSIGEPGFDMNMDPNHLLAGTVNIDYRLVIECVSIKAGFLARTDDGAYVLDGAGDAIAYSSRPETHMHLENRAPASAGGTELHWNTFIIYDPLGRYEPSEPLSIVFVKEPPAGDLVIDGIVNLNDLLEFCFYWLSDGGSLANDFYERADANRDGQVNLADFAGLAANWTL
jgi:hypothetical protein